MPTIITVSYPSKPFSALCADWTTGVSLLLDVANHAKRKDEVFVADTCSIRRAMRIRRGRLVTPES